MNITHFFMRLCCYFRRIAVSNMNVKEEKICRLCLKIANNDFQIIDESTRKMFEVLLLRVNLDITKDPVICKDCGKVAVKCFNFKSVYMSRKERKFYFAIDKNRPTCELIDVYKDEKDIAVDDNSICCFCLNHTSGGDCVTLDNLMNDITFAEMLQVLMPELDFDITNPMICTSCKQDLECYIKFVKNSLEIEEKITNYIQKKDTPTPVKLSKIIFENIYPQLLAIKKEEGVLEDIGEAHPEIYDSKLIKSEAVDIKDEVNFKETVGVAPSEVDYLTKLRNSVKQKLNMPVEGKKTSVQSTPSSFTPTNVIKCHTQSNLILETGRRNTKQVLSTKNSSKERYIECTICIYRAKDYSDLKNHMLIHKDITDMDVHKCSMCTYATSHKGSLMRHTLVHKDVTEVEMYKCSMCGYETKHKGSLKTHNMLIHKDVTEVQMHKCSICNFETRLKSSLVKHMLIHKDVTEVEMHKCPLCTHETKHKKSLKGHMLIHEDITQLEMFKCSKCTYETKRKGSLKSHMLIHKDITEVKIYKCTACVYQTIHRSSFNRHIKFIHKDKSKVEIDITHVKKYKCTMCVYETKHKSSLNRHIKFVHKDMTKVEISE